MRVAPAGVVRAPSSCPGVEGAMARAVALAEAACEALAPYGARADRLREAARFAVARDG